MLLIDVKWKKSRKFSFYGKWYGVSGYSHCGIYSWWKSVLTIHWFQSFADVPNKNYMRLALCKENSNSDKQAS